MASKGINKVILVGNLGKEPEMRYTPSGRPVTTFSLATTRTYKSGVETVSKTEWHNIEAWGRVAEIIKQYAAKGQELYLEGRIEYRSWEDNREGQEGKKHFQTVIVMSGDFKLGPSRNRIVSPEAEAEVEPEPEFLVEPAVEAPIVF
jgi:single-strand DNA-binding protein